eukprot:Colp12_sorted_trinity150504_noHs@3663
MSHHHHHGSCSHEAHEHGHGHDHDDHESPERGSEYSLYKYIDMERVRCLNESVHGAAKTVFKPWESRLDHSKFVESDADEQLIIYVPFTGSVTLKSIVIIADPGDTHPTKLKVYTNREDVDFDNCEQLTPVQDWDLQYDRDGSLEYATRISKFQNVHSLTLYFPENNGGDTTKIQYIGFKGDFRPMKRDTIVTVYEAIARPSDHKVKDEFKTSHTIQ